MHVDRIIVYSVGQLTSSGNYTAIDSTRTIDVAPTSTTTMPPISFGAGTYIVGDYVQPSTYWTQSTDGCYWERLSGFSGNLSDIISNDFLDGQSIVEIKPTDAGFYTSSNCGTWQSVNVDTLSNVSSITDGVWAVGSQMATGLWTAPSTSGCYWARLSGFGSELADINDNDYTSGNVVVQVLESDIGFNSSGCGTWAKS